MRNLHSPTSDRGNWVDQRTSEDKTTSRQRMATRAVFSSVVIVLGGWLLVSCGSAVAAENANPEVVFDGTSCIYEGPAKIQGGGIEFTLTNDSDTPIDLFALLYDDPGDYQADLESLAVGADADVTLAEVPPGLSFGLNLDAQPRQQATTLTILDIGKHILQCGHTPADERFPDHIWRAATIEVIP